MPPWRNDLCDRGHSVSVLSGNVGWRERSGQKTRFCKQCRLDYDLQHRYKSVPNPVCRRNHDLNNPINIGVKVRPRTRTIYYCLPCAQLDGLTLSRPLPPARDVLESTVEPWMAFGACVGADPQLFSTKAQRQIAFKQYCDGCPVKISCGNYADRYRLDGMWGGLFRLLRKSGRYVVLDFPDVPSGSFKHEEQV